MAISPVLAIGGLAVAPVAFGALTVGAVSVSLGGAAVGLLALGSLAAGWWAFGVMAVGWKAAAGAIAIAHGYAIGGVVRAAEANTPAAAQWFQAQWFTVPVAIFVTRIAVWLVSLHRGAHGAHRLSRVEAAPVSTTERMIAARSRPATVT